MRLAVLAVLAAIVPCSQLEPIPAHLAQIGLDYEATSQAPLTPSGQRVSFNRMLIYPRIDPTPAGRMQTRLKMSMCPSPIVVRGVVSTRKFYTTQSKKSVFGLYSFEVGEVIRGAGVTSGTTIQVVREGGSVCTPEGRLEVIDHDQAVLEVGESYLLMLTPTHNSHFKTSFHGDWHLGTVASLAQIHSEPSEPYTSTDLLAAARSMSCVD